MHAVTPLVVAEKEPGEQGVHTLSDVDVQGVRYRPAGHRAAEQGVHAVLDVVGQGGTYWPAAQGPPKQVMQVV